MNAGDRKLLLRVAARMERAAKEKYAAAPEDRRDEARRTRDNELGDVIDLKEYVDRADAAERVVDNGVAIVPENPDADRLGAILKAVREAPTTGDDVADGRTVYAGILAAARAG